MKIDTGKYYVIQERFLGYSVGIDSQGWQVFELIWDLALDSETEESYDGYRTGIVLADLELVDRVLSKLEPTYN